MTPRLRAESTAESMTLLGRWMLGFLSEWCNERNPELRIIREVEYYQHRGDGLLHKIWSQRERERERERAVEDMPNQDERRSRRTEWSIVSKVADKSTRVRQVTFWWLVALMI